MLTLKATHTHRAKGLIGNRISRVLPQIPALEIRTWGICSQIRENSILSKTHDLLGQGMDRRARTADKVRTEGGNIQGL